MILIACVDDRGGIAFNHRRQSSDSVVRDRILDLTAGSRLWMNEYSAKQFDVDAMPQINISGEFLNEAVPGDYCLVEDVSVPPTRSGWSRSSFLSGTVSIHRIVPSTST